MQEYINNLRAFLSRSPASASACSSAIFLVSLNLLPTLSCFIFFSNESPLITSPPRSLDKAITQFVFFHIISSPRCATPPISTTLIVTQMELYRSKVINKKLILYDVLLYNLFQQYFSQFNFFFFQLSRSSGNNILIGLRENIKK